MLTWTTKIRYFPSACDLTRSRHWRGAACGQDGDTALILASQEGNEEIARMLVAHNADIHCQNRVSLR